MKLRTIVCFSLLYWLSFSGYSQQKEFQWRIGASGGYTNYYGDLSPYKLSGLSSRNANLQILDYNQNYSKKRSFNIFLEKQLSATIGLMLNYGSYHYGMSDRFIKTSGELYVDNPNFSRGLNFQNHTQDVGLSFVFKTDNDRFLSSSSLIAPYFTLGAGYLKFDVNGDLLDGAGNRYDHNLTGIIHDQIYETNLPDWNTELVEGYDLFSFYAKMGLGFRVRLGKRLELFAQSDFIYTFTDFLDDVSGKYRLNYDSDFQAYAAKPGTNTIDPENPYRGNPDSPQDWIIYHGVGLKFNFGASKKTFSAPRVSTYNPIDQIGLAESIRERAVLDSLVKRPNSTINNFTYNVQLIETERLDSLSYAAKILNWDQEIQKRETRIIQGNITEGNLVGISRTFESQYESLIADTRLDAKEKETLLAASEQARFGVRYSIDSLNRREKEQLMEIDSIEMLKRNLLLTQRILVLPEQDSLYQKQTTIIDSVFQTQIVRSEVTEMKGEQIVKNEASSEQPEQMAEIRSAFGEDTANSFRINQIEQENRYLKSERDRILLEYADYKTANKSKKEKPQSSQNTQSVSRKTVNNKNSEVNNENDRRRKWWWPFAAVGGAATVIAIADGQNDNDSSVSVPVDSTAIANAFMQSEPAAYAISTAFLGFDPKKQPIAVDSIAEAPISVAIPLPVVEILHDTIYVETLLPVTMLEPKQMIFFELNQRVPDIKETDKLAQLGQFIKENEDYILVLTGFADNTGIVNYSLKLAQERMNAVADFLKSEYGLTEDQIKFESGGQVIRSGRQAANAQDRRVEVRAEKKGEKL